MKWAGLLGRPVIGSLSPALHSHAFATLGLSWRYRRIDCGELQAPSFLGSLGEDCAGLSVTMPCKRSVLSCCDVAEPMAAALGVANTVVNAGGVKAAFNTDVRGIVETLRPLLPERYLSGPAVVVGNGATACSAVGALASLGFKELVLLGRNFEGSNGAFVVANRLGINVETQLISHHERSARVLGNAGVVVSTVPPDALTPFVGAVHPAAESVALDVSYAGKLGTLRPLDQIFGEASADPLAMLTHQGLAQVKLWTNEDLAFAPTYAAVQRAASRLS